MLEFVTFSEQYITLDKKIVNVVNNVGFETTHTGLNAININQNDSILSVSGHVIFNQVGSCTMRRNNNINGTSRQKHFIQSLCATVPGKASPLLQPEAALFPRHFYITSSEDTCSILGARPLFLMNEKHNPYGFCSVLSQARLHMSNPYSTTSTDNNLMCYYFDQLANIAMNGFHSQDIYQRGFVVDNKSATGLNVRDKDRKDLEGSVDSKSMVLNLSASQEYIKYTWFLTFTANQKDHPGLCHLHKWKNSLEWTKNIEHYEKCSDDEKNEYKKSMEEAYGTQIYHNWRNVKHILLLHIRHHITVLGSTTAIFACDEYQSDDGNLCHNHLILVIDKRTMNGNTQAYIQDLIRTSMFDVVKFDDISRLISNGLLKSFDDIPEIVERAGSILSHNCNERCKMRIRSTGDPEKDFKCQKIHPVKDSPDPTQHSYVEIKVNLDKTTLDILEEIDIYSDGKFRHPYFCPKRHISPCNFNATCNMSPIISDFFIALKSMQNAQALDHTNGLTKYVCKYISKFDEGNYAFLMQDIHTGELVLGKVHLHNTKIVRSKINEDKAYSKERLKNHCCGCEIPVL